MPILLTRTSRRGARLALAVRRGDEASLAALLSRPGCKAYVDWAPTAAGHTPLSYAAQTGNVEAATALLDAGADVRRGSEGGCTPLHWAAWRGHLAVLLLLLARGADVGHRSAQGCTALDYASFFAQSHCVRALLEAGSSHAARDGQGRSPLHWAAQSGCTGSLAALLDAGAAVDARDDGGSTPLMFASRSGCCEAAALLLRRGADVAARNTEGLTAAAQAGRKNPERAPGVLAVLASHGSAATAVDDEPAAPAIPASLEAWLGALQLSKHAAALQAAAAAAAAAGAPGSSAACTPPRGGGPPISLAAVASLTEAALADAGLTPRGLVRFAGAAQALHTPESKAAAAAAAAEEREVAAAARQCVVCMCRDADAAFAPCGHVACCASCAMRVMAAPHPQCPVCRSPSVSTLRLFYVS